MTIHRAIRVTVALLGLVGAALVVLSYLTAPDWLSLSLLVAYAASYALSLRRRWWSSTVVLAQCLELSSFHFSCPPCPLWHKLALERPPRSGSDLARAAPVRQQPRPAQQSLRFSGAVPFWLVCLGGCPTPTARQASGGGPPPSNFYKIRDTLRARVTGASLLRRRERFGCAGEAAACRHKPRGDH
jgi:hypothetical protein